MTTGQALSVIALGVGGFAVGKAAIDHVLASRGSVHDDLSEFEEQHYRAAGFTRAGDETSMAQDLVALGATIFGVAMLLKALPAALDELKGYAP